MYSLAIDSSNGDCSIAIYVDQQIIDFTIDNTPNQQAGNLFLMLESMFKKNHINYSSIKEILVVVGPGSFTGIRIAIAAVRGINLASNIPIIGLSNFQIIAFDSVKEHQLDTRNVVSVLNARRNQFYIQQFTNNLYPLGAPQLLTLDQLCNNYSEDYIVCDLETMPLLNSNLLIRTTNYSKLNAKNVAMASSFFKSNNLLLPVLPLYIRPPDAVAKI